MSLQAKRVEDIVIEMLNRDPEGVKPNSVKEALNQLHDLLRHDREIVNVGYDDEGGYYIDSYRRL